MSSCFFRFVLSSLAVASAPLLGIAQTPLSAGHVDIGIAYEGGAWDLHVHKEVPLPEEEYAPADALLVVGGKAQLPGGVPSGSAATAFFGAAGSPLWVLPKTQDADLLFLGLGAEELDPADWPSGLSLRLERVEGPGSFFLWDVGAFGELLPKMSSRDGLGAGDKVDLIAGSHGHYFMGFSAPGDYAIDFSVTGTHVTDGVLTSEAATYHFQVVPEPGAPWLLALGAGLILARRPRRGLLGT